MAKIKCNKPLIRSNLTIGTRRVIIIIYYLGPCAHRLKTLRNVFDPWCAGTNVHYLYCLSRQLHYMFGSIQIRSYTLPFNRVRNAISYYVTSGLFGRALLESCQDVCIVYSQVGQEHVYESKKIVRHIESDHITSVADPGGGGYSPPPPAKSGTQDWVILF